MPIKFDPKIHHRQSVRLLDYDYTSPGAYFVTIATWQRNCLFGDVVNSVMILNELGKIVDEEWQRTPVVRPNVELGAYMIMPNHFHRILVIHDHVGASRRLAPTDTISPKSGSLGAIMAQFKSIVTKRIW